MSNRSVTRRSSPRIKIFDGSLSSVLAYIDQLPREGGGCVLWDRGTANGRYGRVNLIGSDGRYYRTGPHRLALETRLGRPLRSGMRALHRCDTPLCVNAQHLWEGTMRDNVYDMITKGRWNGPRAMTPLGAP